MNNWRECGPDHDDQATAEARELFIQRTRIHGQYALNEALRTGCYDEVWDILNSDRYSEYRSDIVAAGFSALALLPQARPLRSWSRRWLV